MKKYCIIILLNNLFFSLFSQITITLDTFNVIAERPKFPFTDPATLKIKPMVFESFVINGVKQKLDSNYKFYFVYQNEKGKVIYIPTIKK